MIVQALFPLLYAVLTVVWLPVQPTRHEMVDQFGSRWIDQSGQIVNTDPYPTTTTAPAPRDPLALAYEAAARGDMVAVIELAAEHHGRSDLAGWAVSTARCESGLNPWAWSGYYIGLFQHDPGYWPGRAAAAGFAGADPYDPVANVFVSLWMRASGYGWQHWPVCGR